MFYYYFEKFTLLSSLFGMSRPFVSSTGQIIRLHFVHKIWTLIILAIIVTSYCLTSLGVKYDFKENLDEIFDLNDLVTNLVILTIHLLSRDEVTENIYEQVNSIIKGFKLSDKCLKLFSMKLYAWFSLPTIMFVSAMILEFIFDKPAYVLLSRIPTYLAISHLILHIYVKIALLKAVNNNLEHLLPINKSIMNFEILEDVQTNLLKYLIDPDISFDNYKRYTSNLDLKYLCTIYDQMSTSMKLLENLHGMQILFIIWLSFSSAVVGVTLIACDQAIIPWLVIVKTCLPYFWCFMGCYVGEQMKMEVERTEMLIIKHLIDFRCDQPRKNILESFKQLVTANRLQFTACNLFDLSYSMILGMVMNVITYSIILIQLFISN